MVHPGYEGAIVTRIEHRCTNFQGASLSRAASSPIPRAHHCNGIAKGPPEAAPQNSVAEKVAQAQIMSLRSR